MRTKTLGSAFHALLAVGSVIPVFPARAMVADQFYQMTEEIRGEYVVALVKGTSRLLEEQGRGQDAQKVYDIFSHEKYDGFQKNVLIAIELNTKRPEGDKLLVEHAFIRTLQQNGIKDPPQGIMEINKDFNPHVDRPDRNKK